MRFTLPMTYDSGYLVVKSVKGKILDTLPIDSDTVIWTNKGVRTRHGVISELYLNGVLSTTTHTPHLVLNPGDSIRFNIDIKPINAR